VQDWNNVGEDGAQSFLELLERNTTLTSLTLAHNRCGQHNLDLIEERLAANRHLLAESALTPPELLPPSTVGQSDPLPVYSPPSPRGARLGAVGSRFADAFIGNPTRQQPPKIKGAGRTRRGNTWSHDLV